MTDRRTRRRLLTMPLLIVLGAAVVWVVGSQQRQARDRDVRRMLIELRDDLRAGGGAPPLRATEPVIARALRPRLRAVIEAASAQPAAITFELSSGDREEAAGSSQPATHTAMIRVGGRDDLGLRIHHPGRARDIAIIGFWSPE